MPVLVAFLILEVCAGAQNSAKTIGGIVLDPEEEPVEEVASAPSRTLSVLATTPLLNENVFEQKFSTWMPQLLVGFPAGGFMLETGARVSISVLNFGTANSDFTHYFLDIPLHVLATLVVTEKTQVALVLGLIVRALEYDTRTTSDGGWARSYASANLLGEAGLMVRFVLSRTIYARIDITTAQMGGGLELAF